MYNLKLLEDLVGRFSRETGSYLKIYVMEKSFDKLTFDGESRKDIVSGNIIDITVNCIKDGKVGRSSGSTNSELSIEGLIEDAYKQMELSDVTVQSNYKEGNQDFTEGQKGNKEINDITLEELSNTIEYPKQYQFIESVIELEKGKNTIYIVNSSNGKGFLESEYANALLKTTIKHDGLYSSAVKTGSASKIKKLDLNKILDSTAETAKILITNPMKIDYFQGDILISPYYAVKIFKSLLISLSASNIINGSSFFSKIPIGDKIASEKITLTEDPFVEESEFSRKFDDQLIMTTKKDIIKNGILITYLHDIETAAKFNVKPTGNYFRKSVYLDGSVYRGIFVTNARVLPGKSSFGDILSNINDGIYVLDSYGPSPYNGKFNGNLRCARIKNGRIENSVSNALLMCDMGTLINNIAELSSNSESYEGLTVPYLVAKNIQINSL